MTYLEKIRSMSVDELAEFIDTCDEYDGFMGKACNRCKHRKNEWECDSDNISRDCKAAVKALLNTEVKEDATRKG